MPCICIYDFNMNFSCTFHAGEAPFETSVQGIQSVSHTFMRIKASDYIPPIDISPSAADLLSKLLTKVCYLNL